jgi:hypothetical protein
MTMIFTVMTWPKSPTVIELHLSDRTGDLSVWYRGPEFGLQLLMDAWHTFRRYTGPGEPWTDEATAAEFELCHELYFGEGASGKPDTAGFLAKTAAIVKRFEVDEGDGHGEDCGYTLEVTDPRYAVHMQQNRYWETAYVGHLA